MNTIFHFSIDCDWIPHSEKSLPKLFDIIERFKIKPTFFLTGKFVEDYREYVEEMRIRNYEIGSHGLNHGLDSKENFGGNVSYSVQKKLLSKSSEIINKATGCYPTLFRSPMLHISDDTFKVLSELNYKIDSSIPVRRFDFGFGYVNNIRHISKSNTIYTINNSILEIPPSAYIFPLNMRLLRVFGVEFAIRIFNIIRRKSNFIVFYLHPAEFVSINELDYPHDVKRFYKTCGPHNYQKLESFLIKVFDKNVLSNNMSAQLEE